MICDRKKEAWSTFRSLGLVFERFPQVKQGTMNIPCILLVHFAFGVSKKFLSINIICHWHEERKLCGSVALHNFAYVLYIFLKQYNCLSVISRDLNLLVYKEFIGWILLL